MKSVIVYSLVYNLLVLNDPGMTFEDVQRWSRDVLYEDVLEHFEAFEDQITLMNLKCYVDYRAIPNLYRELTFKITQTEVIWGHLSPF